MTARQEGGIKAAETIKKVHGADFYARIGSIGGKRGTTGGFASNLVGSDGLTGKQRAKLAGARGGAMGGRNRAEVEDN